MTGVSVSTVTAPALSLRSRAWHFARHFFEMCVVAMCIGGGLLNAVVFVAGPALIGYPDLREQSPELALLVIAFVYALPMATWMLFRGMGWRPTVEMSAATGGLAVVMGGLAWLGVVSETTVRAWALGFCGPACVVMVAVMLFRLDLYTGRTGHGMGHGDAHRPRGLRASLTG